MSKHPSLFVHYDKDNEAIIEPISDLTLNGTLTATNQIVAQNGIDSQAAIWTTALDFNGGAGPQLAFYNRDNTLSSAWTGSAGTWSGSSITVTATAERLGNIITLVIETAAGLLAASGYITSGVGYLPADYRPTANVTFAIPAQDNNAPVTGTVNIRTDGEIRVYSTGNANFTQPGIAGWLNELSLTYSRLQAGL